MKIFPTFKISDDISPIEMTWLNVDEQMTQLFIV